MELENYFSRKDELILSYSRILEELEKEIRKDLKDKLTKAAANKIQDLEKALASLEEEKNDLPNGGDGEEEDFVTKAKRVLSETVTVK